MKNLIIYRVYLNHITVTDEVYAALEAGGKNESDAYVNVQPLHDYMDATPGTRWPDPDEEIDEELEVLSLE